MNPRPRGPHRAGERKGFLLSESVAAKKKSVFYCRRCAAGSREEHRRPHVLCAEFQTGSGADVQARQREEGTQTASGPS